MLGVGAAACDFYAAVVLLVAVGFFEGEPRWHARGGKRRDPAGGPGASVPPGCGVAWLWDAIVMRRITHSRACTMKGCTTTLLQGGRVAHSFRRPGDVCLERPAHHPGLPAIRDSTRSNLAASS